MEKKNWKWGKLLLVAENRQESGKIVSRLQQITRQGQKLARKVGGETC